MKNASNNVETGHKRRESELAKTLIE